MGEINSWKEWPDDVVDTLLLWNHASVARLRFPYTNGFTCSGCGHDHVANNGGDACLDGKHLCDTCLIDHARRFVAFLRRTHGLVEELAV
jgi:hypothetical protein